MASRWRQRETTRPSTWRQSLLFNSLLLLLPIMASRIIIAAYTSDIATDPMSLQARTETRAHIEDSFRSLTTEDGEARAQWARRIEATLSERDFPAARGYLLAAPLMMDRKDSQAVLAAAEAEEFGTEDQRIARAALLFLPDAVRASYQRAISPPATKPEPVVSTTEVVGPGASESGEELAPGEAAEAPDESATESETESETNTQDPLGHRKAAFLLGDWVDLVRLSQRWWEGEQIDELQLRLRALGLIQQARNTPDSEAFVSAASALRAAHRSGRLKSRFARYISRRIDDALPGDNLRESLGSAFEPVMTTEQRVEYVMQAYENAIDEEALVRLSRDMTIIARLVELTSSQGALTLLEQASSPEDMRRALLVTEVGGERSVALAREIGPDVLELAQIGVKWNRVLVLQTMALVALGMALLWTALSAFTQAETIRPGGRR